MCKHGLVNLLHLLFVAPLLLYIGLQGNKCPKLCFNLLVLLGLTVFAYHAYRYLMTPVNNNDNNNDNNNNNNNNVHNDISSVEAEVGEKINVEMEVIDVESVDSTNKVNSPAMFEPAFESNLSNDSMDGIEGFTW